MKKTTKQTNKQSKTKQNKIKIFNCVHSHCLPLCVLQLLPSVIEAIRVLPLVTFPLVYFVRGEKEEDEKWIAIGVLVFFVLLLIMILISTLKTGSENPGTVEKLTR